MTSCAVKQATIDPRRHGSDLILVGDGTDNLYGNTQSSTATTPDGNNTIRGGNGNDQIYSGAGDDIINGEAGNDRIDAGAGDDHIWVVSITM